MSVWTYIGQIVNILVFVVILYFLLYKPVRRVMQQRKDEMEAELREAEKKLQEAEKIRGEAEKQAKELEDKRDSILKEARDQAEAQRKEVLQQTEQQARDRLERFRRIMEQERGELLDKITSELRDTIVRVAHIALKDTADVLFDRALERVAALLKEMSDEELESARRALDESEKRIPVGSAAALTDKQLDRLKSLLREKLGVEKVELRVKETPSLLAGLEVTLGHLRLEAHWRGVLDEALREQQEGLKSQQDRAKRDAKQQQKRERKQEAKEEPKREPKEKPKEKPKKEPKREA